MPSVPESVLMMLNGVLVMGFSVITMWANHGVLMEDIISVLRGMMMIALIITLGEIIK